MEQGQLKTEEIYFVWPEKVVPIHCRGVGIEDFYLYV